MIWWSARTGLSAPCARSPITTFITMTSSTICMRDEVGGSCYWVWAPGRTAKFQCDFSAMISPAMFNEFMLPVLGEMCERVSYCNLPLGWSCRHPPPRRPALHPAPEDDPVDARRGCRAGGSSPVVAALPQDGRGGKESAPDRYLGRGRPASPPARVRAEVAPFHARLSTLIPA